MTTLDVEDRVVVLLYMLGEETAQLILENLPEEYASRMDEELQRLDDDPPSDEDIDEVIESFEAALYGETGSSSRLLQAFRAPEDDEEAADEQDAEHSPAGPRRMPPKPFEPSDDPIDDLQRLSGYQVARALADETPQTSALVLSCLPADRAAETLQLMPEALRTRTFIRLNQTPTIELRLLQRIVRTTVTRAATFDVEAPEEIVGDQKMLEMLRAMPKKQRTQLLDLVETEDSAMAERLREQLFVFEDILRIESRSLQRLLMETETAVLLTALQNADEQIVDTIMSNVSRRTREALMEEMQYMSPKPEEQIEAARGVLTRQMGELDRAGQLIMVE
jgi:flagellar motor switch protein FliG